MLEVSITNHEVARKISVRTDGDVIASFLAGNPSLAEIDGALYGDDIDPRCTPAQREELKVARLRRMKEATRAS